MQACYGIKQEGWRELEEEKRKICLEKVSPNGLIILIILSLKLSMALSLK